jgi:hypothetical protein
MEFKGVCGISMRNLGVQVCREIDNGDGIEWTPAQFDSYKRCHCYEMTHFFTQIPQPIQRNSEINAILSEDLTSIQSLPAVKAVSEQNLPFIEIECTHFYYRA